MKRSVDYRRKYVLIIGSFMMLLFVSFLVLRYKYMDHFLPGKRYQFSPSEHPVSNRDTWKTIFMQNQKIGYAHSQFIAIGNGYQVFESIFMRINVMGMLQDIYMNTSGVLKSDFTLGGFDFELRSGQLKFTSTGSVDGNELNLTTQILNDTRKQRIPLSDKLFLAAGIMDAVRAANLSAGNKMIFHIFDPSSMQELPFQVQNIGHEEMMTMGKKIKATKVSLKYKDMIQLSWLDEHGEVIKESSFLGIHTEKTTKEDALKGIASNIDDLAVSFSIPSNLTITSPEKVGCLTLDIKGIDFKDLHLSDDRQQYNGTQLTVCKETLEGLPDKFNMDDVNAKDTQPEALIQSDHPKIVEMVNQIVDQHDLPVKKIEKLITWIQNTIRRQPVLSLPNALTTLEYKMGDCNEHAVLLAAFARASGIPARVNAGLVYLNGRFYYHAWNSVFLGRWITADAIFNQIPADATHIRLVSNASDFQIDLLSIIGKLSINVVDIKML
ncbi:MAG: transglutaminase domain-containing protein [Desulfobacterales bacterium]|nr:transglutaminase domain-containing protein [Desulfobacterales bacterium]